MKVNYNKFSDNIIDILLKKIADRKLVAGVIGLGYVGLPLAVEVAKAGFKTIGFDVKKEKVDSVNQGHSYIGDVADSDMKMLVEEKCLPQRQISAKSAKLILSLFVCPHRLTQTGGRISAMWNHR